MLFALAGMAGACTPQPSGQVPADPRPSTTPAARTIAMDTNSWGREVSRWSIDSAGNGQHVSPEPNAFTATRIVTRRFSAGAQGFADIQALLAGAERQAGGTLRCTVEVTDGAYGQVRWTQADRTASLDYTQGCGEQAAKDVVNAIARADAKVHGWALAGAIVETKPVEK